MQTHSTGCAFQPVLQGIPYALNYNGYANKTGITLEKHLQQYVCIYVFNFHYVIFKAVRIPDTRTKE